MNQKIEIAWLYTNLIPKEELMRLAFLEASKLLTKRVLAGTTDFLEGVPENLTLRQISKTRNKIFISKLKSELVCERCSENHPACIDFHHLHSKKLSVSKMVHAGLSLDNIINELKKCSVLCSNCHRKDHFSDSQIELNLGGVSEVETHKTIY